MREYAEGVLYHEVGQRHDRAELLRMLQYVGATTSRLLNVSSVASDLGVRRETVQSRLASLDASFLVHLLPSHRLGEHRTVTAHPKVHAVDTGLAAWAARAEEDPPAAVWGGLVETFVVNELLAQSSSTNGSGPCRLPRCGRVWPSRHTERSNRRAVERAQESWWASRIVY